MAIGTLFAIEIKKCPNQPEFRSMWIM